MDGLEPPIQGNARGKMDGRLKAVHGEKIKRKITAYPHRTALLYNPAMDTTEPAPVIRRRKVRGRPIVSGGGGRGMAKGQNNYLAEAPKNPVGARPGNRNAVTHGCFTAEFVALRKTIRVLKARAILLIAQAERRP
jgi:hypothetical protein